MSRCRCDPITIAGCQCNVVDSNCIDTSGTGSAASPYSFSPILDPAASQLLSCGPAGLLGQLPLELRIVPTCRVYHSLDQSIATGVTTVLSFNSERYDTDSMHSTVTNTSRITFTTAGVYVVTGGIEWDTNSDGRRAISIRLNGTDLLVRHVSLPAGTSACSQATSTIYKFAAGDYVELLALHTVSGSSLSVLASGQYSPEFAAARVAAG